MATPLKSYSKRELADLYEVSSDTFRRWVRDNCIDKLGVDYRKSKVLLPWQVKVIFEKIGPPEGLTGQPGIIEE